MIRTITDEQVALARKLRGEGKSYPEIAAELGGDLDVDTIRGHCLDVAAPGDVRTRTDKPVRQRKDGATIRGFTETEDAALVTWMLTKDEPGAGTLNGVAKDLGRARHSCAARIKTLQKHGRIPAA